MTGRMEPWRPDGQVTAVEVAVKGDTAHQPGSQPMDSGRSERIFADAADRVQVVPEPASGTVRSR
jgi:hypothetical protein